MGTVPRPTEDWGRDLALYLGRKQGGLKLRQLGALAGIDYAGVSMALQRSNGAGKTRNWPGPSIKPKPFS